MRPKTCVRVCACGLRRPSQALHRLRRVGDRLKWLLVVAILLVVGSGCMPAVKLAEADAETERAAAERASAEAQADQARIQAEAEARATELEAQARADAERARAETERVQAQAEADRAASEIQRALGDRAISEAVADQVTANSEFIRARATVERAQASQYKAGAWALYALAGGGLLMIVGVAVRLILAGVANVRRAGDVGPTVLDVTPRRRSISKGPETPGRLSWVPAELEKQI